MKEKKLKRKVKRYFNNFDHLDKYIEKDTITELIYNYNVAIVPNIICCSGILFEINKRVYKNEKFKIIMELYMPGEETYSVKSMIYFPEKNYISVSCSYKENLISIVKVKVYIQLIG